MPDDQTYRPERKKISMSDIDQYPDMGSDSEEFNRIHNLQKSSADLGNQDRTEVEPGVKISGNVPPALQAMFNNKNKKPKQEEDDTDYEESPMPVAPPRPKNRVRPELAVTGHADLDVLVARLRSTTQNYDKLTLPSLGRFYDGSDGPLDGIIHVRPMTGEEEQILATPRYVKKGKAIDMIFSNCVREKIAPERLLTVDRTFLLIFLRGISYTPNYDVEIKCPECSTKFSTTIDLNSLKVEPCPEEFTEDSLEETMPKCGFKFIYRLSRGDDEAQVNAYREQRVRMFGDNVTDDTLAYRTSLLLQEVEGLRDQRQIQMLAKSLPIGDMNHIRNLVNEPPFGVKTDIDINCPNCFAEFTVDLPMETNFFFPRRKKVETQA